MLHTFWMASGSATINCTRRRKLRLLGAGLLLGVAACGSEVDDPVAAGGAGSDQPGPAPRADGGFSQPSSTSGSSSGSSGGETASSSSSSSGGVDVRPVRTAWHRSVSASELYLGLGARSNAGELIVPLRLRGPTVVGAGEPNEGMFDQWLKPLLLWLDPSDGHLVGNTLLASGGGTATLTGLAVDGAGSVQVAGYCASDPNTPVTLAPASAVQTAVTTPRTFYSGAVHATTDPFEVTLNTSGRPVTLRHHVTLVAPNDYGATFAGAVSIQGTGIVTTLFPTGQAGVQMVDGAPPREVQGRFAYRRGEDGAIGWALRSDDFTLTTSTGSAPHAALGLMCSGDAACSLVDDATGETRITQPATARDGVVGVDAAGAVSWHWYAEGARLDSPQVDSDGTTTFVARAFPTNTGLLHDATGTTFTVQGETVVHVDASGLLAWQTSVPGALTRQSRPVRVGDRYWMTAAVADGEGHLRVAEGVDVVWTPTNADVERNFLVSFDATTGSLLAVRPFGINLMAGVLVDAGTDRLFLPLQRALNATLPWQVVDADGNLADVDCATDTEFQQCAELVAVSL